MKTLKIELDDSAATCLEEIAKKVGGVDQAYKKGLALLDIALAHQDKGGTVIFRHKDGREETFIAQ